jgi:hypothetical protein
MDRTRLRRRCLARPGWGAALLFGLLSPAAWGQPGFGACFPPVPPPDYENRREFELAVDQYFDEVSAFYACYSDRMRTLREDYATELEAEIARLRAFYAEMVENEAAILREDKALVDREYRDVLDAYRARQ